MSRDIIQYMINQKTQYNVPFYGTRELAESVFTQQDHFPYKYWFRGQYASPVPIVAERSAGYRPRFDRCYKQLNVPTPCNPQYCWNYPCSTIWPCRAGQAIQSKQVEIGENVCEGRCNIANRLVNISP